jgi:glycosyltransferase involved in cell wall biosynthesis
MIKATVGILTFNSEKYLKECLDSVKNFKEIIILDGNSTDKTLLIAKKFKCKIFKQPRNLKYSNNKIKNFSEVRNHIIKLSSNNLILFLDSDEFLHKKIIGKIKYLSSSIYHQNNYYSFLLARYPLLNKRIIKKTSLFPNFQERLIYKSNIKKFVKLVHERPISKNDSLKKGIIKKPSILFNLEKSYDEKFKYYYKIEKKMLKKKEYLNNFKFVSFRLLVILKRIIRFFIFNTLNNNKLKYYEWKLIKVNLKFSVKLIKHIL